MFEGLHKERPESDMTEGGQTARLVYHDVDGRLIRDRILPLAEAQKLLSDLKDNDPDGRYLLEVISENTPSAQERSDKREAGDRS